MLPVEETTGHSPFAERRVSDLLWIFLGEIAPILMHLNHCVASFPSPLRPPSSSSFPIQQVWYCQGLVVLVYLSSQHLHFVATVAPIDRFGRYAVLYEAHHLLLPSALTSHLLFNSRLRSKIQKRDEGRVLMQWEDSTSMRTLSTFPRPRPHDT